MNHKNLMDSFAAVSVCSRIFACANVCCPKICLRPVQFEGLNDHTSGIPIHDCLMDRHLLFLTTLICNENERHDYIHPMQLYTHLRLPMSDLLDIRCRDP